MDILIYAYTYDIFKLLLVACPLGGIIGKIYSYLFRPLIHFASFSLLNQLIFNILNHFATFFTPNSLDLTNNYWKHSVEYPI